MKFWSVLAASIKVCLWNKPPVSEISSDSGGESHRQISMQGDFLPRSCDDVVRSMDRQVDGTRKP